MALLKNSCFSNWTFEYEYECKFMVFLHMNSLCFVPWNRELTSILTVWSERLGELEWWSLRKNSTRLLQQTNPETAVLFNCIGIVKRTRIGVEAWVEMFDLEGWEVRIFQSSCVYLVYKLNSMQCLWNLHTNIQQSPPQR